MDPNQNIQNALTRAIAQAGDRSIQAASQRMASDSSSNERNGVDLIFPSPFVRSTY